MAPCFVCYHKSYDMCLYRNVSDAPSVRDKCWNLIVVAKKVIPGVSYSIHVGLLLQLKVAKKYEVEFILVLIDDCQLSCL